MTEEEELHANEEQACSLIRPVIINETEHAQLMVLRMRTLNESDIDTKRYAQTRLRRRMKKIRPYEIGGKCWLHCVQVDQR